MHSKISPRVLHIPGVQNTIADIISHEEFDAAYQLICELRNLDDYRHVFGLHHMSLPPELLAPGAEHF